MNEERGLLFKELLDELETDEYYVANSAFHTYHRTVAQAYVEVLVVRKVNDSHQFFLTRRAATDLDFPGQPWHIPGGVWRTADSRAKGCNVISEKELKIPVRFVAEVTTHKWLNLTHKLKDDTEMKRYPISHVCICVAEGTIPPTVDGLWFSEIPENTIERHIPFLKAAMRDLTVGRGPIRLD